MNPAIFYCEKLDEIIMWAGTAHVSKDGIDGWDQYIQHRTGLDHSGFDSLVYENEWVFIGWLL